MRKLEGRKVLSGKPDAANILPVKEFKYDGKLCKNNVQRTKLTFNV
jgi:hypothetical protein